MFNETGSLKHQSITGNDWDRVEPPADAVKAAVAFLREDPSATRGNLMDYMAGEGWTFTSAHAYWVMDHLDRS